MRLKRLAILLLFLLNIYLGFATKAIGESDNSSPFNRVCSSQSQAYQGFSKPPSDTLFCLQWNFGVAHGINLWEAWTATERRGEEVKVAVIDGGFHYDAKGADFSSRLFLPGFDYIKSIVTKDISEDYKKSGDRNTNHGTNTLGIIGQETNNGRGAAGVASRIEAILYKLDLELASEDQVADAIIRAVKQGADIVNLSLDSNLPYNDKIQSASEYAYQHNVLIVAAAGNNFSNSLKYPIIRNAFDEDLKGNIDGFRYRYKSDDFIKDKNGDYIEDKNGKPIKFKDGFYDSNDDPIQTPPIKLVRALIVSARNEQGEYPKYSDPVLFDHLNSEYNYGGRVNISAPGGEFPGKPCESIDEKSIDKIENYAGGVAQVDFEDGRGTVVLFCKGTSQATAHVSGVAALVISVLKEASYLTTNGRVDPDMVISIIEQSAHISEHKSKYKNRIFKLGEHAVGHEHRLDAGIAVKLAKAVARPLKLLPPSLTPEKAEEKVAEVISQKVETLIKRPSASPFPLYALGSNTPYSDSVATTPSPSISPTSSPSLPDSPIIPSPAPWYKSFNIFEELLVVLLSGYLLFSNFQGFLFFVGILAFSHSSLWLLTQLHENKFLTGALLLSLPVIAVIVLIDPILKRSRLRWLFAGISFGSSICLMYSDFLEEVTLLDELPFLRLLIIPCAILMAAPAWLSIKDSVEQPFRAIDDEKHKRFAWGLSIGSTVVLIFNALSQRSGSFSINIVIVAFAVGLFLLSRSLIAKNYRRLTFNEATGCAIILTCVSTVTELYSSSLSVYALLPNALLVCTGVVYLIAWFSSRKK